MYSAVRWVDRPHPCPILCYSRLQLSLFLVLPRVCSGDSNRTTVERNVTKKVLKHFDSFAHFPSNVELLVRSNIDEFLFIEPGSKIITPNNNMDLWQDGDVVNAERWRFEVELLRHSLWLKDAFCSWKALLYALNRMNFWIFFGLKSGQYELNEYLNLICLFVNRKPEIICGCWWWKLFWRSNDNQQLWWMENWKCEDGEDAPIHSHHYLHYGSGFLVPIVAGIEKINYFM